MSAEAALRQYCSSSLVANYDRLNDEAKRRLLDAMISFQKDIFLNDSLERKFQKDKKLNRTSLKKCPLVKALLENGVQASVINDEVINRCKRNLQSWGNDESIPKLEFLMQYHMRVRSVKDSPEYNESFQVCQTNSTVIKPSGKLVHWESLKKINVRDLKLFDTCWGCYLECVIMSEAIVPHVGGAVLLQDELCDFVTLSFYNFLPEGIRGVQAEPFLAAIFPFGCKIRIAEPFLKIFRDGRYGLRVDNRSEISVDKPSQKRDAESDINGSLEEQKKKGNEFFAEKKYTAALDVYASALISTDFVPTILSNRCQAFIALEQWYNGLLDAAASLTIRPNSEKTWARYNHCLSKIQENQSNEDGANCTIFLKLIPHLKPPFVDNIMNPTVDTTQAIMWKAKGNDAFKNKTYTDALLHYSNALLQSGCTVQSLLNNWAQCAIEIDALNDIIAATCAAIRIGVNEKSVYRLCKGMCFLGEYELAKMILAVFPSLPTLDQLGQDVRTTSAALSSNLSIPENVRVLVSTPPLLSRLVGPVEPFMTTNKGRGLRATSDLTPGCMILVDRRLAKAEVVSSFTISSSGKSFDSPSTAIMKSDLVHRCHTDYVLSDILERLADGTKTKPLVPLRSLMQTMDSCQILLPGHFSHVVDKKPSLTTENVHNIVSTNVFAGKPSIKRGNNRWANEDSSGTDLFPLIALINHSSDPNCIFSLTEDDSVVLVVAIKTILKGSEILIKYTDNENEAQEKWKF